MRTPASGAGFFIVILVLTLFDFNALINRFDSKKQQKLLQQRKFSTCMEGYLRSSPQLPYPGPYVWPGREFSAVEIRSSIPVHLSMDATPRTEGFRNIALGLHGQFARLGAQSLGNINCSFGVGGGQKHHKLIAAPTGDHPPRAGIPEQRTMAWSTSSPTSCP